MKKSIFLIGAILGLSSLGVSATTNQVMCTMQYDPVCGTVTEAGQMVRKTFGNACVAGGAKATDITQGECEPLIGGDMDAHGCKASAGYSWDMTLAKCVRPWEPQTVVDWAYASKLTRFNTVKNFNYDATMTRQEAAAFAARIGQYLFHRDYGAATKACKAVFQDAKHIDTNLDVDVKAACGWGLMLGHKGYFSPKSNLTRGEAIAILIRAVDGQKLDETQSPWYIAYMDRAFDLGLTFANQKGFDEPITRGEFMEWIRILMNQSETMSVNDTNLMGTWNLVSVSALTATENQQVPALKITTTFDGKNLSANMCNGMSGGYTATGGKLAIKDMTSTLMYCEGLLGKIEALFRPNASTYTVKALRLASGSTGSTMQLDLTTASGVVFTYGNAMPTPQAEKGIVGNWYLVGYNTLTHDDTKKAGYQNITLALTENTVDAKFCNTLSGKYTLSGATFHTDGLAATRMACSDATLMKMEAGFALSGATYERNTIYYYVATDAPSEILTIKTKAGDTYTFGKK